VDDFAGERAEPLTRAAEEGAKRALADVGLEGDEAAWEAGHSEHGNTTFMGEAMEVE